MKRILFVGEHPLGYTGNSLMMASILNQVDPTKYESSCFCAGSENSQIDNIFFQQNFIVIPSEDYKENDMWGSKKLLSILQKNQIDYLVMVGIDIWRYSSIMHYIYQLREKMNFKWIWLFPYDLHYLDKNLINLINMVQYPYVYSTYGYQKIHQLCPNLEYFSPPMLLKEEFRLFDPEERKEQRRAIFPSISDETYVFGFIGANQIRKDPQRLIKAFSQIKPYLSMPSVLYLHCELNGVYNLRQYILDCGLTQGDVLTKVQGQKYPFVSMPKIFNAIDCMILPSMQEGLSWTVIQALLCGTPCIISESTAHLDYRGLRGVFDVPMSDLSFIPIQLQGGNTWIESKSCSLRCLKEQMELMQKRENQKEVISRQAHKFFNQYSNINKELEVIEEIPIKKGPKRSEILFAQHSSAGDVLMTTRCFEGIKLRNPGRDIVYMTSPVYKDILKNNPFIKEVIDWDETKFKDFDVVYNPHGEHILHGGFNSLDVKLSDMYPYFCKVTPSSFFIWRDSHFKLPEKPYIVVHTTGGDPVYRTYKHMALVVKDLGMPVVQIGAKTDMYCEGALDYRGITFNQTAYVMHKAEAAVVIDSFPSHLAGAEGTPVVVLYGPAPARVVGPIGDPEKIINIEPDKLKVCKKMTNCWGNARDCKDPCINTISPFIVRKALNSLLNRRN